MLARVFGALLQQINTYLVNKQYHLLLDNVRIAVEVIRQVEIEPEQLSQLEGLLCQILPLLAKQIEEWTLRSSLCDLGKTANMVIKSPTLSGFIHKSFTDNVMRHSDHHLEAKEWIGILNEDVAKTHPLTLTEEEITKICHKLVEFPESFYDELTVYNELHIRQIHSFPRIINVISNYYLLRNVFQYYAAIVSHKLSAEQMTKYKQVLIVWSEGYINQLLELEKYIRDLPPTPQGIFSADSTDRYWGIIHHYNDILKSSKELLRGENEYSYRYLTGEIGSLKENEIVFYQRDANLFCKIPGIDEFIVAKEDPLYKLVMDTESSGKSLEKILLMKNVLLCDRIRKHGLQLLQQTKRTTITDKLITLQQATGLLQNYRKCSPASPDTIALLLQEVININLVSVAPMPLIFDSLRCREELTEARKQFANFPTIGSQKIFSDFSREFLHKCFNLSLQLLGPAPCEVTLLLCGSSSRLDRFPYSDLEVVLLHGESRYGYGELSQYISVRIYCTLLYALMNFVVISVGETSKPDKLKERDKKQEKDQHGFCFDTSTDGIEGVKIDTPEKMLRERCIEKIRENIVTALNEPCVYMLLQAVLVNIETGKVLFERYQNTVNKFLNEVAPEYQWRNFVNEFKLPFIDPPPNLIYRQLVALYCYYNVLRETSKRKFDDLSLFDIKENCTKPIIYLALNLRLYYGDLITKIHPYDILQEVVDNIEVLQVGDPYQLFPWGLIVLYSKQLPKLIEMRVMLHDRYKYQEDTVSYNALSELDRHHLDSARDLLEILRYDKNPLRPADKVLIFLPLTKHLHTFLRVKLVIFMELASKIMQSLQPDASGFVTRVKYDELNDVISHIKDNYVRLKTLVASHKKYEKLFRHLKKIFADIDSVNASRLAKKQSDIFFDKDALKKIAERCGEIESLVITEKLLFGCTEYYAIAQTDPSGFEKLCEIVLERQLRVLLLTGRQKDIGKIYKLLPVELRKKCWEMLVALAGEKDLKELQLILRCYPAEDGYRPGIDEERAAFERGVLDALIDREHHTRGSIQGAGFFVEKFVGDLKEEILQKLHDVDVQLATPKPKDIQHSHLVLPIDIDGKIYYFKFFPEFPGFELAVSRFYELMIGYGTARSMLVKINLGKKSYPVLISEKIVGPRLDEVFAKSVDLELPADIYTDLFLMDMFILPNDKRAPNVIIQQKVGDHGLGPRLISIDNDLVFGDPIARTNLLFLELQKNMVMSVIFCLRQIADPLALEAVDRFLSLNPRLVLDRLLEDLERYRGQLGTTFEESELLELANTSVIAGMYRQGGSPCIKLPSKRILEIYQQMKVTQDILERKREQKAYELLPVVVPNTVTKCYMDLMSGRKTASARVTKMVDDCCGGSIATAMSRNGGRIVVDSITTCQMELDKLMSQGSLLFATKEEVEGGRVDGLKTLPPSLQLEVINLLNWHGIPETAQGKIINILNSKDCSSLCTKLIFRNCHGLDNKQLVRICKDKPNLQVLRLSGCNMLEFGEKIVLPKDIWMMLQTLYIENCQSIVQLSLPHLPNLTKLVVKKCENLAVVSSAQAIRQDILQVDGCQTLVEVNNVGVVRIIGCPVINRDILFAAGKKQLNLHHYEIAMKNFDQAIAAGFNSLEIFYLRGMVNQWQGFKNREKAEADFKEVIKRDPNNPLAWHGLGLLAYLQGNYLEMLNNYIQSVKIGGNLHESDIKSLIELFATNDEKLCEILGAALATLNAIGVKEILPAMYNALQHRNMSVRFKVSLVFLNGMGVIDDRVVKVMAEVLCCEQLEMRQVILNIFEKIKFLPAMIIDLLIDLLADKKLPVYGKIFTILTKQLKLGNVECVAQIKRGLQHANPLIRWQVFAILDAVGIADDLMLPILVESLRGDNPDVQLQAFAILESYSSIPDGAVMVLGELLHTADEEILFYIERCLPKISYFTREFTAILLNKFLHNTETRLWLYPLLQKHSKTNPEVVTAIKDVLPDSNAEINWELLLILNELAAIDEAVATPILLNALQGNDVAKQKIALSIFSKMDAASLVCLKELLVSPDINIRFKVGLFLQEHDVTDEAMPQVLNEILQQDKNLTFAQQWHIVLFLEKHYVMTDVTAPVLLEALLSYEHDGRIDRLKILKKLSVKRLFAKYVSENRDIGILLHSDGLAHKDPAVRWYVVNLLNEINALEITSKIKIDLSGCNLTPEDVSPLIVGLKANTSVITLDFRKNRRISGYDVMRMLETLEINITLQDIFFDEAPFEYCDKFLRSKIDALMRPRILRKQFTDLLERPIVETEIKLDYAPTDAEVISLLAKLKENKTVTFLKFSWHNATDVAAEAMLQLLESNASSLRTTWTDIGSTINIDLIRKIETMCFRKNGLYKLQSLLQREIIETEISFWRGHLTDAEILPLINKLRENNTVTAINFVGNEIGSVAAQAILKMLETNTTLLTIDFGWIAGGDEGGELLEEINRLLERRRGLRKLQAVLDKPIVDATIDLASCGLTDHEILSLINKLKNNTTVTKIDLNGNKLTDASAQEIVKMLETNHALLKIYFHGSYFHDRVVNKHNNHIGESLQKTISELISRNSKLRDECFAAANINDTFLVLKLLNLGVSVLAYDRDVTTTLLHIAVRKNNIILVHELLQRGANRDQIVREPPDVEYGDEVAEDEDKTSFERVTPIELARLLGYTEIATKLEAPAAPSIPILLHFLHGNDIAKKKLALSMISEMDTLSLQIVMSLVEVVCTDNSIIRGNARDILVKHILSNNDMIIGCLKKLLVSSDINIRSTVALLLHEHGMVDEAMPNVLREVLQNDRSLNFQRQWDIVLFLAQYGLIDDLVVPVLAEALLTCNADNYQQVFNVIEKLSIIPSEITNVFCKLLANSKSAIRDYAYKKLLGVRHITEKHIITLIDSLEFVPIRFNHESDYFWDSFCSRAQDSSDFLIQHATKDKEITILLNKYGLLHENVRVNWCAVELLNRLNAIDMALAAPVLLRIIMSEDVYIPKVEYMSECVPEDECIPEYSRMLCEDESVLVDECMPANKSDCEQALHIFRQAKDYEVHIRDAVYKCGKTYEEVIIKLQDILVNGNIYSLKARKSAFHILLEIDADYASNNAMDIIPMLVDDYAHENLVKPIDAILLKCSAINPKVVEKLRDILKTSSCNESQIHHIEKILFDIKVVCCWESSPDLVHLLCNENECVRVEAWEKVATSGGLSLENMAYMLAHYDDLAINLLYKYAKLNLNIIDSIMQIASAGTNKAGMRASIIMRHLNKDVKKIFGPFISSYEETEEKLDKLQKSLAKYDDENRGILWYLEFGSKVHFFSREFFWGLKGLLLKHRMIPSEQFHDLFAPLKEGNLDGFWICISCLNDLPKEVIMFLIDKLQNPFVCNPGLHDFNAGYLLLHHARKNLNVVEILKVSLRHSNKFIAWHAACILYDVGRLDVEFPDLMGAFMSDDPYIIDVALAIVQEKTELPLSMVDVFLNCFDGHGYREKHWLILREILFNCARENSEIRRKLRLALEHTGQYARWHAAMILFELGYRDFTFPDLLMALNSYDYYIRKMAYAILKAQDKLSQEIIVLLIDRCECDEVRSLLVEHTRNDSTIKDYLIKALLHKDLRMNWDVAKTLYAMGIYDYSIETDECISVLQGWEWHKYVKVILMNLSRMQELPWEIVRLLIDRYFDSLKINKNELLHNFVVRYASTDYTIISYLRNAVETLDGKDNGNLVNNLVELYIKDEIYFFDLQDVLKQENTSLWQIAFAVMHKMTNLSEDILMLLLDRLNIADKFYPEVHDLLCKYGAGNTAVRTSLIFKLHNDDSKLSYRAAEILDDLGVVNDEIIVLFIKIFESDVWESDKVVMQRLIKHSRSNQRVVELLCQELETKELNANGMLKIMYVLCKLQRFDIVVSKQNIDLINKYIDFLADSYLRKFASKILLEFAKENTYVELRLLEELAHEEHTFFNEISHKQAMAIAILSSLNHPNELALQKFTDLARTNDCSDLYIAGICPVGVMCDAWIEILIQLFAVKTLFHDHDYLKHEYLISTLRKACEKETTRNRAFPYLITALNSANEHSRVRAALVLILFNVRYDRTIPHEKILIILTNVVKSSDNKIRGLMIFCLRLLAEKSLPAVTLLVSLAFDRKVRIAKLAQREIMQFFSRDKNGIFGEIFLKSPVVRLFGDINPELPLNVVNKIFVRDYSTFTRRECAQLFELPAVSKTWCAMYNGLKLRDRLELTTVIRKTGDSYSGYKCFVATFFNSTLHNKQPPGSPRAFESDKYSVVPAPPAETTLQRIARANQRMDAI